MASESVGAIMVVALTVSFFGVVAGIIMSWCWTFDCVDTFTGSHHGVAALDAHDFSYHTHDANGNPAVCWPYAVKYHEGRAVAYDPSMMQCQAVATAKDPGDNWHETGPQACQLSGTYCYVVNPQP